jgi:hypothetical protein
MAAPHYGVAGCTDPIDTDRVTWEHPVSALHVGGPADGSVPTLSAEQIGQWHWQRFLVIDGIWPAELVAEAGAQWAALSVGQQGTVRRSGGSFPWGEHLSAADLVAVHSRILRAVAQLLGTDEIMLTQSGE